MLSFHSNFLWGTLSNALEKSSIIKSVWMLECRLLSSSWLSVSNVFHNSFLHENHVDSRLRCYADLDVLRCYSLRCVLKVYSIYRWVDFGIMFLKNVVLYVVLYSKKSQWPNTFGTSLCIIKNKFVIFHSFTIPKVIFNTTILISNIFPSSSKAAPSHINNIQFKVLIRSSVQN